MLSKRDAWRWRQRTKSSRKIKVKTNCSPNRYENGTHNHGAISVQNMEEKQITPPAAHDKHLRSEGKTFSSISSSLNLPRPPHQRLRWQRWGWGIDVERVFKSRSPGRLIYDLAPQGWRSALKAQRRRGRKPIAQRAGLAARVSCSRLAISFGWPRCRRVTPCHRDVLAGPVPL